MNMVPIVQLVRASDCGSECRGFESHWAPRKEVARLPFFVPAGVQIPRVLLGIMDRYSMSYGNKKGHPLMKMSPCAGYGSLPKNTKREFKLFPFFQKASKYLRKLSD